MPLAEAFPRRVAEYAMNGDPRCVAEMLRPMGEVETRRREEEVRRGWGARRRSRLRIRRLPPFAGLRSTHAENASHFAQVGEFLR